MVRDILTSEGVKFLGERVEFEVDPPIVPGSADQGGGAFRLIPDEGRIVVTSEEGGIYVQGRHAITIEPRGANSVVIRLLDSLERTETAPVEPVLRHEGNGPCPLNSCDGVGRHDHWPDGTITRSFR